MIVKCYICKKQKEVDSPKNSKNKIKETVTICDECKDKLSQTRKERMSHTEALYFYLQTKRELR